MKKVIDISGWQDEIDWNDVVNAGVTGVIIKISQGTRVDGSFATHLYNAIAHDLDVGVYCFSHASTVEEALAEANEVVYNLNQHGKHMKLGVWFDMESDENLNTDNPTALASAFIAFCNKNNYMAGIYTSLSIFTDVLDINQLADYVPYWVAQYNSVCNFKDYYPNKILAGWQYSDSEYIGNTNVDMNEWYI